MIFWITELDCWILLQQRLYKQIICNYCAVYQLLMVCCLSASVVSAVECDDSSWLPKLRVVRESSCCYCVIPPHFAIQKNVVKQV